jgi:hypothetical protein
LESRYTAVAGDADCRLTVFRSDYHEGLYVLTIGPTHDNLESGALGIGRAAGLTEVGELTGEDLLAVESALDGCASLGIRASDTGFVGRNALEEDVD